MWRVILAVLAVTSIANAGVMWFAPQFWYDVIPGMPMMGPFNLHFVRDIALIFLFSGGALSWGAWKEDRAIAVAGTAWPAMHAIFHIQIWIVRGVPFDDVALVNLVAIQVPAWLALYAALQLKK